jgi:ATP-dependent Clp protease protease subunit
MEDSKLLNLGEEKPEQEKEEKEENFGKRLLKARVIMISEPISDKLARSVATQCIVMQEESMTSPITIYINSPGGSADSGFAIFDLLRFVSPPIRTICTGLCASAAVLIFLAPPKEARFTLLNSRFLLHQPSTSLFGTASDIEINAHEIIKLRERYNTIVATETNKKLEQVTQDADRDFWLSATEALEYGLVGKVIHSFKEIR